MAADRTIRRAAGAFQMYYFQEVECVDESVGGEGAEDFGEGDS